MQAFQAAVLLGSTSLYTVMHMTLFYGVAPCDVSCCGCFCCFRRLTRRIGEFLNTLLYMPFYMETFLRLGLKTMLKYLIQPQAVETGAGCHKAGQPCTVTVQDKLTSWQNHW